MRNLVLLSVILFCFSSCVNNPFHSVDQSLQTTQIQDLEIVQSSHPDTILIVKLSDGKIHEFYQVTSDHYNLYTKIKGEDSTEVISFAYYRYEDYEPFYTDGFYIPIHYVVSQDKRYIYIATSIMANSNGWISDYQIFRVDVESKKTKLITECAAIKAVSDGFIVAQARLTNEGVCVADEIWYMHDEKINFDGKVIDVSDKEYDSFKKYSSQSDENVLLKGFKRCTGTEILFGEF